jgi:hypothetical protein
MDKAGRLTMVKSVPGAIPIHQLLVLAPSKKTLRLIVKIERSFLWAGRAAANGGHCHVNWQCVARPIALGGLGVHDLERTSMALRLRWMWFSQTDNRRAWHGLELQFTDQERALFFAATTMILGDGHTAKFWDDRGWMDVRSRRSHPRSTRASLNVAANRVRLRTGCRTTDGQGISTARLASRKLANICSFGRGSRARSLARTLITCVGSGLRPESTPPNMPTSPLSKERSRARLPSTSGGLGLPD